MEEFKHLVLKKMFKNSQRGQTGALITGLIFGIASLIIGVIIAFVIVSTLTGANLLQDGRTSTAVTNESAILNYTAGTETLDEVTSSRTGYTITAMWGNDTGDTNTYITIPLANASVSTEGVVTVVDGTFFSDAKISYTYLTKTSEEITADGLSGNFTSGVDNVSAKIPTILLVAAIVLILGVLVLLVATWQRMNIGGGIGGGI